MSRLSNIGEKRLRTLAKKRHGVAVYAHYDEGKTKFRYLGDWSHRKKRK